MGFFAKVFKCECCVPKKQADEEATEIVAATKPASAGIPSPKTPPKESQKTVLKQLVKQFLKNAQGGIEVAFLDHARGTIVSGVFRLMDKLQTIAIADQGNEKDITNYSFDDVRDIVKITTLESFEADTSVTAAGNEPPQYISDLPASVPYGVEFIFVQDDTKPLILSWSSAEEQVKFYAAVNVIQHLARRRT